MSDLALICNARLPTTDGLNHQVSLYRHGCHFSAVRATVMQGSDSWLHCVMSNPMPICNARLPTGWTTNIWVDMGWTTKFQLNWTNRQGCRSIWTFEGARLTKYCMSASCRQRAIFLSSASFFDFKFAIEIQGSHYLRFDCAFASLSVCLCRASLLGRRHNLDQIIPLCRCQCLVLSLSTHSKGCFYHLHCNIMWLDLVGIN